MCVQVYVFVYLCVNMSECVLVCVNVNVYMCVQHVCPSVFRRVSVCMSECVRV